MRKITRRLFIETFGKSSAAMAVGAPALLHTAMANTIPFEGKKLNVALCGLGNYAGMLAEGLMASQYCRLAGIVTGHAQKAAQWKKDYNIPDANIYNYETFDAIAANRDIDLVYVVLPNFLHKEFVIRAAKAGKHVITEKPMATSVKDCMEMIGACRKAGVQLAVGYRLHYEPYHLELKRLGQEKVLGSLRYIEAGLGYKTYDTLHPGNNFNPADDAEWRLNKIKAGGGPLMDLGVYCVQCCRYLSGEEPVAVTAQYGPVNDKKRFSEVEESITWQMEFSSGIIASCSSSYGFNVDRLYAAADEGFIEMSPALSHGPFKGRTNSGELNFPVINQQAKQLDEIGKLLLENKPLPAHITGEEGIKDIRIISAAYEAANTGKKVLLNH